MKVDLESAQKDDHFMSDIDAYLESVNKDIPNIKPSLETIRGILDVIQTEIESENKITRAAALMASYRLFKHYRSFMLEMVEMKEKISHSIMMMEKDGVKK